MTTPRRRDDTMITSRRRDDTMTTPKLVRPRVHLMQRDYGNHIYIVAQYNDTELWSKAGIDDEEATLLYKDLKNLMQKLKSGVNVYFKGKKTGQIILVYLEEEK